MALVYAYLQARATAAAQLEIVGTRHARHKNLSVYGTPWGWKGKQRTRETVTSASFLEEVSVR